MSKRSRCTRIVSVVVGAAAMAVVMAGCGGGSPAQAPGAAPAVEASPAPQEPGFDTATTVAEAKVATVAVFESPAAADPIVRLANPQASGTPLVFVVEERRPGWVRVLLPLRPNGSTGWVRAEQVGMSTHGYRVEVKLASHRVRAYDGSKLILDEPAAVGIQATPTPVGRFYVKEILRPPTPNGPYGAYALGLSAFSETLETFGGGEAVIGIHGTNDPSSIGADVSNGCIRLGNDAITTLAENLPLGTPVEIRA